MMGFKQFLKEMPTLNTHSEKSSDSNRAYKLDNEFHQWPDSKKVAETEHHNIYRASHKDHPHLISYRAVHRTTGRVDAAVTGGHSVHGGTNHLRVGQLSTRAGSKMKSHEFYHHLIHKAGLTITSSDNQNMGSLKTWKRLSKMKGIHMSLDSGDRLHKWNWRKNYGKFGDWGETTKADQRFVAKKK